MATHSSILAWRIPWTDELGRLPCVHRITKSQTWLSDLERVTLPGKGRHTRLLPWKTMCLNSRELGEGFYNSGSKVGFLTRLEWEQGLHSVISGVTLLILMSFSVPFNLMSGDFLTAPPLNLPFGTQGRSGKLESCLWEMGDRKASMPWSPTGPCSISVFILGTHRLGLLGSSSQIPITSILCWCWRVHPASFSVSLHLSSSQGWALSKFSPWIWIPATSSPTNSWPSERSLKFPWDRNRFCSRGLPGRVYLYSL